MSVPPAQSPRPRVAALDGLRGLAVVAVLLFHGGYLGGGFLGVDLFFVLSGYLITALLLREWGARGAIGLGQFWSSRARRLLPALLLAAFVVRIGIHLFAAPGTLATLRGDLVGTLTYTANWRFVAQGTSYWTDLGPPSPLQHVWSLAIEEQFYLLWPVAVIGLLRWRRSPRPIVVVAILLAVASTIAMAFTAFPGDSSRAYFGTDTHAAPILLGAALAALFATRGTLRGRGMRRLLDVAAVLALAGVVSAWLLLDGRTSFLYHGGFLGFAVLCAIVIAALSHPDPGPLGRALSWRPLAWVGLISYGLYLFHWPVYLWLTPQSTGLGDGLGLVGVRLALTFALAIASFYALEQPVRQRRISLPMLRAATPVCGIALVVLLVAVTSGARTTSETLGTVRDRARPPTVAQSTSQSTSQLTTRVMVLGDSISLSVGTGLSGVAVPPRPVVWNRGLGGCGLIRAGTQHTATWVSPTQPECLDYPTQWRASVEQFRPEVVVLVASAWDLFDRNVGGARVRFGTRAWDTLYRAELEGAIRVLTNRGARLELLTAPCIDVTSPFLQPAYSIAFRDARVAHLNRLVVSIARQHGDTVRAVDFNRFVCPHGTFAQTAHGVDDLRGDGIHLSPAGQALVGEWLHRRVERIGAGA
jgi:peptidoglycan/LPS O-acetylase OafA/YrhL